MCLRNKEILLFIILKGFSKEPVIKQSLIDCCFFSFLIKAFARFKKLIRFHRPAFILYKIGESFKILIEIFRQKLTVSNVILAFLDHLKPKNFRPNMVPNIERPYFKISGCNPVEARTCEHCSTFKHILLAPNTQTSLDNTLHTNKKITSIYYT